MKKDNKEIAQVIWGDLWHSHTMDVIYTDRPGYIDRIFINEVKDAAKEDIEKAIDAANSKITKKIVIEANNENGPLWCITQYLHDYNMGVVAMPFIEKLNDAYLKKNPTFTITVSEIKELEATDTFELKY